LGDLVVTCAATLRPVVAETGDRKDDQAWIALLQGCDGEPEALEHTGAEVLHQYIGAVHEVEQHLTVVSVLQVEGDRLLVAVSGQEVRRLRPLCNRRAVGRDERWSPAAGVVAARGVLDFHDAGAEVTQHHGGVRASKGPRQVDDEHVVQRSSGGHGGFLGVGARGDRGQVAAGGLHDQHSQD